MKINLRHLNGGFELWIDFESGKSAGIMLRKRDEGAIGLGWYLIKDYKELYLELFYRDLVIGYSPGEKNVLFKRPILCLRKLADYKRHITR